MEALEIKHGTYVRVLDSTGHSLRLGTAVYLGILEGDSSPLLYKLKGSAALTGTPHIQYLYREQFEVVASKLISRWNTKFV